MRYPVLFQGEDDKCVTQTLGLTDGEFTVSVNNSGIVSVEGTDQLKLSYILGQATQVDVSTAKSKLCYTLIFYILTNI